MHKSKEIATPVCALARNDMRFSFYCAGKANDHLFRQFVTGQTRWRFDHHLRKGRIVSGDSPLNDHLRPRDILLDTGEIVKVDNRGEEG